MSNDNSTSNKDDTSNQIINDNDITHGTVVFPNKDTYHGEIRDRKKNGNGKYTF